MTEDQVCELLAATWVTSWPTVSQFVPFALQNEAFALPTTGDFATFGLRMTASRQGTSGEVGTRAVNRDGWILVKLWTPTNTGTARINALKGFVRSVFELKSLGPSTDDPVTIYAGTPTIVGTDGRWYMELMQLPFTWIETL